MFTINRLNGSVETPTAQGRGGLRDTVGFVESESLLAWQERKMRVNERNIILWFAHNFPAIFDANRKKRHFKTYASRLQFDCDLRSRRDSYSEADP